MKEMATDKGGSKKNHLVLLLATLVVCAAVFGLFGGVIHHGFVYDDYELVVRNGDIRDLSVPGIGRMFSIKDYANYLPLRVLSYAVDYHFWGLNPAGYHITNIVLHAANCALVFFLVLLLFEIASGGRAASRPGAVAAAAAAALLFAAHPIHVEAVTWISGRKEVLYSFFFLLGFYIYVLRRVKGGSGRASFDFIAVLLCFAAAMMSKATAVAFPFALVFFDWCFPTVSRRTPPPVRAQEHAVMFVALAALLALDVRLANKEQMISKPFGGGAGSHLLTIAKLIPFYLEQIIRPTRLSVIYDAPTAKSIADPIVLASILICAGVALLIVICRRRSPLVSLGAGWFVIALGPTLNVVPFGTFAADRYAYLALFGVSLIVGAAVAGAAKRGTAAHSAAAVLFVAAIAGCIFLSVQRNDDWKDSISLWRATTRTAPRSGKAAVALATAYIEKGEMPAALAELRRAGKLDPDYAQVYTGLALYYLTIKDLDAAERSVDEGLSRFPGDLKLVYHKGIVDFEKGDLQSASRIFAWFARNEPGFMNSGSYFASSLRRLKGKLPPDKYDKFVKSLLEK
jgi:hypothetical protein